MDIINITFKKSKLLMNTNVRIVVFSGREGKGRGIQVTSKVLSLPGR